MSDEIVVQVTESPIILQYTKQGIEGPPGPVGPQGADGITWELEITMTGSPDGHCTLQLYKNGYLNSSESHYVYVEKCPYNSSSFSYDSANSGTIRGTLEFNYTNVRMFRVTAYSDSDREIVLCANTCNFGRTATVAIGNVEAVPQGSQYVTNVGTDHDAVLDFGLPKGDEPVVAVGTTTNGGYGADPLVTGREGDHNPVDLYLDFIIPNGTGDGSYVDEPNDTLVLVTSVYYTPSVDNNGLLSWTNNGGISTNPSPVQVTIKPRGEWSSSVSDYKRLETITYNGSSYMALQDVPQNTLPTNTTYWQLIAKCGTDGGVQYATFEVDTTTGYLNMISDDGYGGANFSINESSGQLVVTI